MKDVLLLPDNARPHISFRTREAVAKTGRTVVPHPAHSPDLASTDCHLFSPVRDALRGRHFVDKELKQTYVVCSEVKAGNCTALVYSMLLNVGRSVLKMTETLWKNSLIIEKCVLIIHVNLIVIVITFLEKKLEALLSHRPSYVCMYVCVYTYVCICLCIYV
jgi:hypothetical protein